MIATDTMLYQVISVLAAVGILCNAQDGLDQLECPHATLFDIDGVPLCLKDFVFNDITCRVVHGTSYRNREIRLLQTYCGQSMEGNMRVAVNRRTPPYKSNGKLELSEAQMLEIVKPLGGTGSVCCSGTCHSSGRRWPVGLKAETHIYDAKLRCHNNTRNDENYQMTVEEISFLADDYSCSCSGNKGPTKEHSRHRTNCPVPLAKDRFPRYCCNSTLIENGNCREPPEWSYGFQK